MTAFDVDLAELRGAVAELVACQRDLLALAGDIDDAQAQVQQGWLGLAGAAQDSAYGTWRDQCAEMVTALAAMQAVMAAADAHYTTAVEANLALWRQVSA